MTAFWMLMLIMNGGSLLAAFWFYLRYKRLTDADKARSARAQQDK